MDAKKRKFKPAGWKGAAAGARPKKRHSLLLTYLASKDAGKNTGGGNVAVVR